MSFQVKFKNTTKKAKGSMTSIVNDKLTPDIGKIADNIETDAGTAKAGKALWPSDADAKKTGIQIRWASQVSGARGKPPTAKNLKVFVIPNADDRNLAAFAKNDPNWVVNIEVPLAADGKVKENIDVKESLAVALEKLKDGV